MKRSGWLKRDPKKAREWQQRSAGLRRSGPIKSKNEERRAEKYERNYGDRGAPIRAMRCLCDRPGVVCAPDQGCSGDITASHTNARGMGGAKGDRRDMVPLCYQHSVEAGERRTSQRAEFEEKYGASLMGRTLEDWAEEIAQRLDDGGVA